MGSSAALQETRTNQSLGEQWLCCLLVFLINGIDH